MSRCLKAWIHPHRDWSIKYPVVRLSFGGDVDSLELQEDTASSRLYSVELAFDLKIPPVKSASERTTFLHSGR